MITYHMDVCIFIHAKFQSSRIPYKNLQMLGGRTLVDRAVTKALKLGAGVVLDSDRHEVLSSVTNTKGVVKLLRPPELADNNTDGNALLRWAWGEVSPYSSQVKYLLQVNCCVPFLQTQTIQRCLDALRGGADSCATVVEQASYGWVDGYPTYNWKELPNSYELKPSLVETHGVYGCTVDWLNQTGSRVGPGA